MNVNCEWKDKIITNWSPYLTIFFSLFFKRYQLFLQVKQDVLQGRLPVSFELAAELGAYVVQCKYIAN